VDNRLARSNPKVIHSLKEVAMTEDQKNQQKNDAQPGDIARATL